MICSIPTVPWWCYSPEMQQLPAPRHQRRQGEWRPDSARECGRRSSEATRISGRFSNICHEKSGSFGGNYISTMVHVWDFIRHWRSVQKNWWKWWTILNQASMFHVFFGIRCTVLVDSIISMNHLQMSQQFSYFLSELLYFSQIHPNSWQLSDNYPSNHPFLVLVTLWQFQNSYWTLPLKCCEFSHGKNGDVP